MFLTFVTFLINVCLIVYLSIVYPEISTSTVPSPSKTPTPPVSAPEALDTTNVEVKMQNKLLPLVENIRYDLNIVNPDKVLPSQVTSSGNISTVDWTASNASLASLFTKRRPVRIVHSSASTWPAIRWDWWHLSTRFPLLAKVLAAPPAEAGAPHVIITQHERDAGGMIDTFAMLSPAESVDDVLMANFLYDSGDPSVHHFFSSNYRVFESIAKVTSLPSYSIMFIGG